MPKKKVSKQARKAVQKKSAPKLAAARKAPAKGKISKSIAVKKKAASAKTVAKSIPPKPANAKTVTKSPAVSNATSSASEVSLGRPLVTQEEKLYMLFHDDYQARQVFEFLRVDTVKELEQFSQQQIVHMMSKPLRLTVERIRQRLAQYKRSLKDDEQFAADYLRHAE